MRPITGITALAAWLLSGAANADESVDLELVLLADASQSIDNAEILFQRQGYADAITHPEILAAIGSGFDQRIAVTYVEWGDMLSQEVVVPWTIIDGPESAQVFAQSLMEVPRRAFGPNAIGSAIAAAHALIDDNTINGHRRIIDFSADSANSFGGVPLPLARQQALAAEITINGLAILCRQCSGRPVDYDLEAAFTQFIIGGPGAFVITADATQSFSEAVRQKLLLEIAGAPSERRAADLSGGDDAGIAVRQR